MKANKYFLLLLALPLLLANGLSAEAQSKPVGLELNYSIASPLGSFRDYVSRSSFNGWQASLMYAVTEKISVGLGVGFQDFYEKYPRQVYKLSDGSDISAVVTNSLQTIPVLLQGRYNFMPGAKIQPYAGLGIGGNMILYDQYLGEFSDAQNSFAFTASPQAGVFIPLGKNGVTGLNVVAGYSFIPYNKNGLDNLNNWNAGIGIKFPLH